MPQLPPDLQLTRLASAYQLSRAVQVAARLGLGRLLADGPRTVTELAESTSTHAPTLTRLLRFLAEIGVVAELDDGRFGPVQLTEHLHLVDNIAQGMEAWDVWTALPEALRTGRSPFTDVHGAPFYEHAAAHPEQEAHWQEWNAVAGRRMGAMLADLLDIPSAATVIDVGGGNGAALGSLLARQIDCAGVVFDLPGAVAGAPVELARAGVGERAAVVAGDARRDVPAGGDIYLLCRVLFNLNDADAAAVLGACHRALGRGGCLWIVESPRLDDNAPRVRGQAAAELHHFLLWGAGPRSRQEIGALLGDAGFRMSEERVFPDGLAAFCCGAA